MRKSLSLLLALATCFAYGQRTTPLSNVKFVTPVDGGGQVVSNVQKIVTEQVTMGNQVLTASKLTVLLQPTTVVTGDVTVVTDGRLVGTLDANGQQITNVGSIAIGNQSITSEKMKSLFDAPSQSVMSNNMLVGDLNGNNRSITNLQGIVLGEYRVDTGFIEENIMGVPNSVRTNIQEVVTRFDRERVVIASFIPALICTNELDGTSFVNTGGGFEVCMTNDTVPLILWPKIVSTNLLLDTQITTNYVTDYNYPPDGIDLVTTNQILVTTNFFDGDYDQPYTGIIFSVTSFLIDENFFTNISNRIGSRENATVTFTTNSADHSEWSVSVAWVFPENNTLPELLENPTFADLYTRNKSTEPPTSSIMLSKAYTSTFSIGMNTNAYWIWGAGVGNFPITVATNSINVYTNQVFADASGTTWNTNDIVQKAVIVTNGFSLPVTTSLYVITPTSDTNTVLFTQDVRSPNIFHYVSNNLMGMVLNTQYIPVTQSVTNYLTNTVSQLDTIRYSPTMSDYAESFLDAVCSLFIETAHADTIGSQAYALALECQTAIGGLQGRVGGIETTMNGRFAEMALGIDKTTASLFKSMSDIQKQVNAQIEASQKGLADFLIKYNAEYEMATTATKLGLDAEKLAREKAVADANKAAVDMNKVVTGKLSDLDILISGIQEDIAASEFNLGEAQKQLNIAIAAGDEAAIAAWTATKNTLQAEMEKQQARLKAMEEQKRIIENNTYVSNVDNSSEDNSVHYDLLPFTWEFVLLAIKDANEKTSGELKALITAGDLKIMEVLNPINERMRNGFNAIREYVAGLTKILNDILSRLSDVESKASSAEKLAQKAMDAISNISPVSYDYSTDVYNYSGDGGDDCDCCSGSGDDGGGGLPGNPPSPPISCTGGCHGL